MRSVLERYARWCARHPWPVLACTALACLVALWLARRLSISADLAAVLPQDAASVRHLELASKRLGSTDALYISVQSPDAKANRRFLDDVAAVLARWPERPLLVYRLDIRYFKDRRLLYTDLADLETVRDNLERRIRWEKVHSNPAYVDLRGDPAPEILPPGLREKYEQKYKDDLGSAFEKGTAADIGEEDVDDFLYLEKETEVDKPGGTKAREWVTAMMIRFPGSSVNVDFAENVVYRAECLIGTRTGSDCADVARWPGAGTLPPEASLVLRVKDYHPEMRAETGGGVRSRVAETNALFRDVRASAIGSLISMTLIVLVAFRRIRALLYVMVPLLVGITMCLGAAAVLHGQLNVITAFTFAVLVGLGIDFGIHLGKRYEEEREGGLANEDAVARAFGSTGKAMALAMITTVLAFATLTSSRFRGFSQFGELCAIGVPLSMIAAYLLFPAIVTLADRVRPLRPRGPRLSAPPVVRRFASRPVGWILVAAIGLTTVAAALASQFLDFEYDYGKLGTKRPIWSRIDTRLATRGYTGSPAVALAETPEQAEAAYRQIKRHMRTDKLLRDAFSIWSFAPEHQERKVRVLTQMDVLMDDPSFGFFEDGLSDEDLDRLDEWRTYLRTGPVVPASAEFPAWAKQLFTELDGRSVGRILYLMPRKSLTDGVEAMRMQDAYETIRLPDGTTVPVAASGFVFADIVRHIKSDGSFVTSLALVGVFLVLFAAYRSLRRTLITIAPLVAGIAWLLGLMVLFRINMTFYSMVMVPVVIGTGIDAAIHLYSRYLELGPGSILTVLRRTGPPVILSAVTTMAGFGSLMFTSHRGLMSMGQVAALGLSTVLVATLIGLPAIVLAIEKRKPAVPRPEQAPAPESPADGPEDAAGAGAPKT